MRCKNCGADNDDNRYICEVCGSPLYDEDDFDNAANDDNDKTQTFKAVNGENYQPQNNNNNNNNDYNDNQYGKPQNNNGSNKNSEKKSLIIIAILAVLLIAIVSSIAVIAHNKNKDTSTTTPLTKVSDRDELSSSSTTKERTTEKTTESTTEKTTKETTKSLWIINTSSSGGGQTQGDGKYENGKTVTLVATADEGYQFDGWYSNGIKVSSSEKYSFTANQNASFSAVFAPVETQAPDTTTTESTSSDIVFGE